MYTVTFRVNLNPPVNFPSLRPAEEIAMQRSVWIPHVNRPLKHGDTFTVSGQDAFYVRELTKKILSQNEKQKDVYILEMVENLQENVSLILSGIDDYGLISMSLNEQNLKIRGYNYVFNKNDINVFNLDDVNDVRFASDEEFTYVLMELDQNDFRFFKINQSGEITLLEIPELAFEAGARISISDGLNDMYDNGNIIATNISNNITYTHSPNNSDGEIVDGTNQFGSGSQYFTNNNDGVFSLVATNVSITSFGTQGNLGADGSGSVKHDRLVVNVEGNDYSLFYRCVYNASDPSVNHIFIVPGNHSFTHYSHESTDSDIHTISDIDGINRVAYLLFATNNGSEVDENTLENVASVFIAETNFINASIENIKIGLNSSNLASLVPNLIEFNDGDNTEGVGGINDLDSLIYIGDGKLGLLNDSSFKILTTDGNVLLTNSSQAFDSFSNLVYFQGQIYGFGYGNILYKVNKETGEVFGEGNLENKKSNILIWKENSESQFSIDYIYLPFVSNNRLFAVARPNDFDEGNYSLIEVFPETNEINWICYFEGDDLESIGSSVISDNSGFEEIGFGNEIFLNEYAWYWSNEIHVDEELFYKTPNLNNLVLEWADQDDVWSDDEEDVETWISVEITGVEYNEENHEYVIAYTAPETENNYILRMKYSDGQKWLYIGED